MIKLLHAVCLLQVQPASPARSGHMGNIMSPPCGVVKLTGLRDLALLEWDGSMRTSKVIYLWLGESGRAPQGSSVACWPFKHLSITAFNFPFTAAPPPLAVTFLRDMNYWSAPSSSHHSYAQKGLRKTSC